MADLVERIVEINRRVWDEWPVGIDAGNVEEVRRAAATAVAATLEAEASEGVRLRAALHGIAHTFTEDSHGGMKTMSASYYQEIARRALIPEAPVREAE